MQRLTNVVSMSLSHYHGKRPYQPSRGDFACPLVSLPDDRGLWSGNETACVHAYKIIENGILRNGQKPGSAVNSFIDWGKLEAMKTLSGGRALHCGNHQFLLKFSQDKIFTDWPLAKISPKNFRDSMIAKPRPYWVYANHTHITCANFFSVGSAVMAEPDNHQDLFAPTLAKTMEDDGTSVDREPVGSGSLGSLSTLLK